MYEMKYRLIKQSQSSRLPFEIAVPQAGQATSGTEIFPERFWLFFFFPLQFIADLEKIMVKKVIDSRIHTLVKNGVQNKHRSFFVIVGDKGKDQVRSRDLDHTTLITNYS
jgi:hypothetical protein